MNKILIRNCQYLVTRPGSIDGIIEDGAVYIEGSQHRGGRKILPD